MSAAWPQSNPLCMWRGLDKPGSTLDKLHGKLHALPCLHLHITRWRDLRKAASISAGPAGFHTLAATCTAAWPMDMLCAHRDGSQLHPPDIAQLACPARGCRGSTTEHIKHDSHPTAQETLGDTCTKL